VQTLKFLLRQLGGALVFYTILPLPQRWPLEFEGISRWAVWIGGLIGVVITATNICLIHLPFSNFLRGVLVTAVWIVITGGLHLDGVMDTADGLAVSDPDQRLTVMSDSRTGAFGVMAAIVLVLLKVGAIADVSSSILWTVPIWGRWAQWLAIVQYPYLKPDGKGAFHRRSLRLPQDFWPSFALLFISLAIALSILPYHSPYQVLRWAEIVVIGQGISWGTGAWFNHRFSGMTGDIYGAVTEWTEALTLCSFSLLKNF
jgi:adenosylcobinamide-GDP ribazoletransferase